MRFKFLIIPLLLISFAAEAQTTRRIQSSDVTGALGYTPIQSIQGMTGIMTCGTGLLCSSQVLSVSGVPIGSVTGLGTGVAASLATNVGVAGAPVLFNGAGGTPSAMTATNLTGTAAGLSIGGNSATATTATTATSATTATTASAVAVGGITGAGSGCITWLTTPSSSNMRGCVTDETGTGLLYFQGGALGTPASATGTNFIGIPIDAGTINTLPISRGGTGDTGTAWTTFVPAPSAAGCTFTVNSAQQKTLGKTVFYSFDLTVASGTCTSSTTSLTLTMPFTSQIGASGAGWESAGAATVSCNLPPSSATISCRSNINLVTTSRFAISGVYQSQ